MVVFDDERTITSVFNLKQMNRPTFNAIFESNGCFCIGLLFRDF